MPDYMDESRPVIIRINHDPASEEPQDGRHRVYDSNAILIAWVKPTNDRRSEQRDANIEPLASMTFVTYPV
jgi:hypothetical protein